MSLFHDMLTNLTKIILNLHTRPGYVAVFLRRGTPFSTFCPFKMDVMDYGRKCHAPSNKIQNTPAFRCYKPLSVSHYTVYSRIGRRNLVLLWVPHASPIALKRESNPRPLGLQSDVGPLCHSNSLTTKIFKIYNHYPRELNLYPSC